MIIDIFLRPRSQGAGAGRLWVGSFQSEHWNEARAFAREMRWRGQVFTRVRKPKRARK